LLRFAFYAFSQVPDHPVQIYTIGHSNSAAGDLIEVLRKNGVQTVVDVRSSPYSQYAPQHNRENIAQTLEAAGIHYVYAGEYLGGRPQDPTCYKHGRVPTGKVDYLKLVDYAEVARRPWYLKGIERLVQIASERPTAVMCSEEDPHHCHRYYLITPTLEARGLTVTHLRLKEEPDNQDALQPQQMSLF
jgi:uncharacterized protein (DUF488 family)